MIDTNGCSGTGHGIEAGSGWIDLQGRGYEDSIDPSGYANGGGNGWFQGTGTGVCRGRTTLDGISIDAQSMPASGVFLAIGDEAWINVELVATRIRCTWTGTHGFYTKEEAEAYIAMQLIGL